MYVYNVFISYFVCFFFLERVQPVLGVSAAHQKEGREGTFQATLHASSAPLRPEAHLPLQVLSRDDGDQRGDHVCVHRAPHRRIREFFFQLATFFNFKHL